MAKLFVPSAQQTSVLYCRLSDFNKCVAYAFLYRLLTLVLDDGHGNGANSDGGHGQGP